MTAANRTSGLPRVTDDAVWRHTKTVFLGALVLFLVNISLGIGNVFTSGGIPRWQFLTHLHAGTIGWVTLSVIGATIWLFTAGRTVSATYARRIQWLAWASILVFAGYVASFGISFYVAGDAMYLLPAVGTAAMLVIWAVAAFALTQVRRQPVVTTVHVLVTGGLLLAAVGATMGVLAGLQNAIGAFLPFEAGSIVSAHRGPMEVYFLIIASALGEWAVLRDDAGRWTGAGMAQAVLWVVAGLSFPLGVFLGLEPLFIVGFLFGLILLPLVFLGRVGWHALRTNPTTPGVAGWHFFGTLWFAVFVVGVVGLLFGGVGETAWGEVVIFHSLFIGVMTNLLFGVLAGATPGARSFHEWADPAAKWLLNLGLVFFFATEILTGSPHGALVMGLGVLLGVGTMAHRLMDESATIDATA